MRALTPLIVYIISAILVLNLCSDNTLVALSRGFSLLQVYLLCYVSSPFSLSTQSWVNREMNLHITRM